MNKQNLLKCITDKAYDVGIGAKKHFASYDLLEKTPGFIGFITMAAGVFGLVIDKLAAKEINAFFIILGTITLYCSMYDSKKMEYCKAGQDITIIFNELKSLYFTVRNLPDNANVDEYEVKFNEISSRFYPLCISKQVFLSNWYAHYKFFWEHQIDWIDEDKKFSFLRDKLPLSFSLTIASLAFIIVIFCIYFITTKVYGCEA